MQNIDKWFFACAALLTVAGFFIFFSASLGLLARDGARFSGVLMSQFSSLLLGAILFWCALWIPQTLLHKYSFYIFLATLIFTAAVFIPGVGVAHGGATRWIFIGPFSLQPSEFLKLGFVLYFAAGAFAGATGGGLN